LRRLLTILVLLTACLPAAVLAGQLWSGGVVQVVDGDSLIIVRGRKPIEVRLFGLDCPEWNQPWGAEAKAFTRRACFREQVKVRVRDVDRYGRLVAQVYLADGRELNLTLLQAGLAWWHRRYAPGSEDYRLAEEAAQRARLGLWAGANPLPPWRWRRQPAP